MVGTVPVPGRDPPVHSRTMDGQQRYAAGWYPDPTGRFEVRYHNGIAWTGDVAHEGRRFVDPLNAVPAPGPVSAPRNGLAVAALVLGITAMATSWMPWIFVAGAVCAVLALGLGITAIRRSRSLGRRGMSIAGVVLGAVALPLAGFGLWLTSVVSEVIDPAPHTVDVVCSTSAGRATADGSITNLSDDEASFLLTITFVETPSGDTLGSRTVQVDDVPAGGESDFSVGITSDADAVECSADVLGGFPFPVD